MLADFTIPIDGVWTAGTVSEDEPDTLEPKGGVPVAVPVLVIPPASTSAWMVV